MKKTPLFAATALLSVLLASGFAEAKATAETKPAGDAMTHEMPMKDGMGQSKLSEATQKLMKESMDKVREANKATFEEMKAKYQELQTILKAPKFDKAAYLAKHEEIQSLHHKVGTARTEAFASVAEKMSVEERASLRGPGSGMGMHRNGMGKGKMHGGAGGPMMNGAPEMAPDAATK